MATTESKKSERKPWWLLVVAIFAIGGIVAAAVAMTAEDDDSITSRGPSSGSIGNPEIRQASWKFTFQKAPGKRLTNKQRASLSTQRSKLKTMTQDLFDAMFLSPEKQGKALKANFTPKARLSYQRASTGVPKGADDVRVRWRSAKITIDGNVRATMDVKVKARGQANAGAFAVEHHSVLYVARERDGWKVFGFRVDQKPIKKNKDSDKDDSKKDEQKSKSSKKGAKSKKGEKGKKRSGGKNRRGDR
ncbi:MAG: hypothetical protein ACRDJT_00405 [Actinomycetota bacterium]